MANELYLDDMYLRKFDAEVSSVRDGKYVVLDKTAFYPKSGGVANDEGILSRGAESFRVVYAGKFGERISHEVDKEGLGVGDKVIGTIDWDRRYTLMRYHTSAHLISGAFYKNLGAKITGNEITSEQARIDFNLENFDRELIEQQIGICNETIQQDLPVEVYYLDREEVDRNPDLVKLSMGIPESIRRVRIVDIKGFDRQPDGGCHVKSLGEIGTIVTQKLVNKGKSNRRLYFTLEKA